MVLMGTPSPRSRNNRFPLSSTTQIVTCTCRFAASASAPATIVLTAARSRYFLEGSWAKQFAANTRMTARVRFNILGFPFSIREDVLAHWQDLNTVTTQLDLSRARLPG